MAVNPLAILQAAAGAIGGVVDQIKKLPDAVRGFVDAFNPATGERLDYAFRSLHSTIGFAVEPILLTTTRIVEDFADAISAGMTRLREPVEKVASAFSGALQPAVATAGALLDLLADGVDALVPFLEPLGAAMEGFASLFRITATLLGQLGVALLESALAPLGDLKTATEFLAEQFVSTAAVVLHFSDVLFRAAGFGDTFDKAIARMRQAAAENSRRAPGAANFGISTLEDVYRKRLIEGARMGGKSKEDMQFDVWKRIEKLLEELVEINRNPAAREQRDRGMEQGFRAGGGRDLQNFLNLFRQEGRNELRQQLPAPLRSALERLGF